MVDRGDWYFGWGNDRLGDAFGGVGLDVAFGVSPFGHTTQLRVFVDPDLLQYDEVWAAAGTWNDVFAIAPNDLVRASGAMVTDLKRV